VCSFADLSFSLGSAGDLGAAAPDGIPTTVPRRARTQALFSLDPAGGESILAPGGSVWAFAFAGNTRLLGTAVELAVWRPPAPPAAGGLASTSPPPPPRVRQARWMLPLGVLWEQLPYMPRFLMLSVGGIDPATPAAAAAAPALAQAARPLGTTVFSDAQGSSLTERDMVRLRCEYAVRRGGVGARRRFHLVCGPF
jgi:hypothetical protein